MIKSFSGQVVFCFAILRAISAYVGENWLSQYSLLIFSKSSFSKYSFRMTIRVLNSFGPGQGRHLSGLIWVQTFYKGSSTGLSRQKKSENTHRP